MGVQGPMGVYEDQFSKSSIGWPQQPPTEKVLKFNLIFHDSTVEFLPPKNIFSNQQNKVEFKNLDDYEVHSSDFQALEPLQPQ